MLPPQGDRTSRGRRGAGIVPAGSPSSSYVGLTGVCDAGTPANMATAGLEGVDAPRVLRALLSLLEENLSLREENQKIRAEYSALLRRNAPTQDLGGPKNDPGVGGIGPDDPDSSSPRQDERSSPTSPEPWSRVLGRRERKEGKIGKNKTPQGFPKKDAPTSGAESGGESAPPPRCYRCLCAGHISRGCPSDTDRSKCCFKCGALGHRMAECPNRTRCPVCKERGLPFNHRTGGPFCPSIPPMMENRRMKKKKKRRGMQNPPSFDSRGEEGQGRNSPPSQPGWPPGGNNRCLFREGGPP